MLCFFDVPTYLNPCSKLSGVKYAATLDDDEGGLHRLAGQEMEDLTLMEVIRRVITATKYFPDAGYPISYWNRIYASWIIIAGVHYDAKNQKQTSKGLLDYLIFPLIARKLVCGCEEKGRGGKTPVLNGLALAIAFPLEIIRVLIALTLLAVLAVTILPVVHVLDMLVSSFFLDTEVITENKDVDSLFQWNF